MAATQQINPKISFNIFFLYFFKFSHIFYFFSLYSWLVRQYNPHNNCNSQLNYFFNFLPFSFRPISLVILFTTTAPHTKCTSLLWDDVPIQYVLLSSCIFCTFTMRKPSYMSERNSSAYKNAHTHTTIPHIISSSPRHLKRIVVAYGCVYRIL